MNTNLDLSSDEALLSSISEHKVGELKLQPYSLLRQSVAMDLVDRDSGTYFSAVMTCYVCSLSEDEALAAHGNRKGAQKAAFKWAELLGYDWHNWRPLVDTYLQLEREWMAVAKVSAKAPDGISSANGGAPDEIPNDGGQPDSLRSLVS